MTNTSLDSQPQDFICQACPNGCHLHISTLIENQLDIQGNKCLKGIDYALQFMADQSEGNIISPSFASLANNNNDQPSSSAAVSYASESLAEIVQLWGLTMSKILPHIDITGSPERSAYRIVFEESSGARFILEQIPKNSYQNKRHIARTLEYLHLKQMSRIQPYLSDKHHRYLIEHKDNYWQIMPFIQGVSLNRATYIYEKWRGNLLSAFLLELRNKSKDIPIFKTKNPFSIKQYIYQLYVQMKHHHPKVVSTIDPVVHFLESDFMKAHDCLPIAFCHGDYHPLNMIWDKKDIKTVIDWEFSGYKPEIYDVANMIGCVGMEHPSSLMCDFILEFISRLREARCIDELSWKYLPDFIIAIRFGWMAEWLRKTDTAMIELESVYMNLLMDEKQRLIDTWY